MKKIAKIVSGLGVKKILLGVTIALIVVSGAGIGIYFATKTSDDPVENTNPGTNPGTNPSTNPEDEFQLAKVEEAFSDYSNDELKGFMTYLNTDNGANIEIVVGETKNQRLQKLWEFYKTQDDLNWATEKEVINQFKELYPVRTTFLQKELDDSIRTSLEDSLSNQDIAKTFAEQETVVVQPNDTKETIIRKILNRWLGTLEYKTQPYFVWKNFRDANFLSYAKQLKGETTTLEDIKALSAQEIYQLHYDCLTQYFKDKISVFNALNDIVLEKLQLFIVWVNSEKSTNLIKTTNKDAMISAFIINYYQSEKLTFTQVNDQLSDFNTLYDIRQTYLSKELIDSIKSELEAKFDTIAKITLFKDQEGVTTLASDSLPDIITKIITKWNENLNSKTGVIPLWKNFDDNENLLQIALNNNPVISLNEIKKSPTALYQIHYESWNQYYSEKIRDFVITS